MRSHIILPFIALSALLTLGVSCQSERPTYTGPDYILFSSDSHTIGVVDNEEWFEIAVSATRTSSEDRYFGVEVVASESSAIEGLHYTLESNTLCIKAGELTTAVRIQGHADNIYINQSLGIKLRLVLDDEKIWDEYGTDTEITMQRCCEFDINTFTGYAVLTSSWSMQYMNVESRLVHTHLDTTQDNTVVIEDMFYDGYDIGFRLDSEDRLNPIVTLCGEQVLGSTGEAFGTVYGNGELMIGNTMGYVSYFGSCEKFVVIYSTIYVEEVGTVGNYVNILEWISDEEAERIMREGL